MADSKEKPELRFTVSPKHYEYLGWLSRETVLGKSENDVAQHVLTQKLSEMRNENYKPEK